MSNFRLEQKDGRWALLNAEGKPFFSLGVDCVTVVDVDLAANQPESARYYTPDRDWFPTMMDRKLQEITARGFNTLGAWHHKYFWGNGYPKAVELRLSQHAKKVNNVWGVGFPDVFDDSFTVSIHKSLIEVFHGGGDRLLRDPGLIGYYTDNELHWWGSGGHWGDNAQAERGWDNTALVSDYIRLPKDSAGKRRWIRFLVERYGTIEALNQAWHSEYVEFDDLAHLDVYRADPKEMQRIKLDFLRLVAETYFEKTSAILKAYDPDRLNLGCRYVGNSTPDIVFEVGKRYVDIDSINFYAMELPVDYLTDVYRITGKPMMITEFAFSAGRDAGFLGSNNGSRNVIVRNQQRRAECYDAFVRAAAALPFMLGAHWFALFDYGRNVHGLIGNYGLYDLNAAPYTELLEGMARTNAAITSLRG